MRAGRIDLLLRAYLILLLMAGFLGGEIPQGWIALALLVPHALALYKHLPLRWDILLTALGLVLAPIVLAPLASSPGAVLLVLPILLGVDRKLRQLAMESGPLAVQGGMKATPGLKALVAMLAAILAIGVLSENTALWMTGLVLVLALGGRVLQEVRLLRVPPLRFGALRLRVIAGSQRQAEIEVTNTARHPLVVTVVSSSEAMTLQPDFFTVSGGGHVRLKAKVSSRLAGPAWPPVHASTSGPWGLLTAGVVAMPLQLEVIPRARYAEWLARRYLQTSFGQTMLIANSPEGPLQAQLRGTSFHALREYQHGDRLRDIAWKQTLKLGRPITVERLDPPGGGATLLINTVASDAEEADRLAYHVLMSALSAARAQLPVFVLAYNQREPVTAFGPLPGPAAVQEALRVCQQITQEPLPRRLLAPPDIQGLRRWERELGAAAATSESSALSTLLHLQRVALEQAASVHPVARLMGTPKQASESGSLVTVISLWNHDAEALALLLPQLKGKRVEVVDVFAERRAV